LRFEIQHDSDHVCLCLLVQSQNRPQLHSDNIVIRENEPMRVQNFLHFLRRPNKSIENTWERVVSKRRENGFQVVLIVGQDSTKPIVAFNLRGSCLKRDDSNEWALSAPKRLLQVKPRPPIKKGPIQHTSTTSCDSNHCVILRQSRPS
jgi:hypothetical protein